MYYYITILFSIFFFTVISTNAQEITHQVYEPFELTFFTNQIYELEESDDYLLTHITNVDTPIIPRIAHVNNIGELKAVYSFDSLYDYQIKSVFNIIQKEDGFVLFLTAQQTDAAFFLSIKTDEQFEAENLISAYHITDANLVCRQVKFNETLNRYDAMFVADDNHINQGFQSIYYLNINQQYEAIEFKEIENTTENSYFATDFFYHPILQRYSIITGTGGVKLLNENWNIIIDLRQVGTFFSGVPVSWGTSFFSPSCILNDPNGLECIGRYNYYENGSSDLQWAGSFGYNDLSSDTIIFSIPVLDNYFEEFTYHDSPIFSHVTKDNLDNYIILAHDGFNTFSPPSSDFYQRASIKKLNPQKEVIWDLEFALPDKEVILSTSLIDRKNDLILVGFTGNKGNVYNSAKSLFVKIYNDGTVATTDIIDNKETLLIYPNPTTEQVTIELSTDTNDGKLFLYNSLGQLVFQEAIQKRLELSMHSFSSGLYRVVVLQNGVLMQKGSIVKK